MKKQTAADRPEFRRDLAEMVQKLDIKAGEVNQDAMVVCTRAADFNPQDNVLWELEANKSAVRNDVHCIGCKSPMAMSNDTYGKYTALDKKPRVCCVHCLMGIVEREGTS